MNFWLESCVVLFHSADPRSETCDSHTYGWGTYVICLYADIIWQFNGELKAEASLHIQGFSLWYFHPVSCFSFMNNNCVTCYLLFVLFQCIFCLCTCMLDCIWVFLVLWIFGVVCLQFRTKWNRIKTRYVQTFFHAILVLFIFLSFYFISWDERCRYFKRLTAKINNILLMKITHQ